MLQHVLFKHPISPGNPDIFASGLVPLAHRYVIVTMHGFLQSYAALVVNVNHRLYIKGHVISNATASPYPD
jgi:hypothetical protein